MKSEKTCLGVIEFKEEAGLWNRQLGFKNGGYRSTELLVNIRIETSNRNQLTVGCWLLSPTKCHGNGSLQHDHHILRIDNKMR